MKTLFKNCKIVNFFIEEIEQKNILVKNNKIIGIGDYQDKEADIVYDMKNTYVCPGFIDSHIHIESTTLTPFEFAKVSILHGTTAVVADPHEITNVCGINGFKYMLNATKDLDFDFYFMVPSCVPATKFDESGATLTAKEIKKLYKLSNNVLGLAEMMNFPGVINNDKETIKKILDANKLNKIINGHAPLLSGKDLDKYISCGIYDDHECSTFEEAKEKLSKGQWIMVRQGSAAQNLNNLINCFDEPFCQRCLLATDDKHPADLLTNGHIDYIVKGTIKQGKSPFKAIKMATYNTAKYFNLKNKGAVALGFDADLIFFNDLNDINIQDVFKNGKFIVKNKKIIDFSQPKINKKLEKKVKNTFFLKTLSKNDFIINQSSSNSDTNCNKIKKCRVIQLIPHQLITNEIIKDINFSNNNGIDIKNDILKIAVVERHKNKNHIGLGFVNGLGLKSGAIASSVAHDSHNLIIAGTNEEDMAFAGNYIKQIGGGYVVVKNGKILASMPLEIAGLMSTKNAETMAKQNENLLKNIKKLGYNDGIEPFMTTAFISLTVIPNLKLTTLGLVDVINQKIVDLFV